MGNASYAEKQKTRLGFDKPSHSYSDPHTTCDLELRIIERLCLKMDAYPLSRKEPGREITISFGGAPVACGVWSTIYTNEWTVTLERLPAGASTHDLVRGGYGQAFMSRTLYRALVDAEEYMDAIMEVDEP